MITLLIFYKGEFEELLKCVQSVNGLFSELIIIDQTHDARLQKIGHIININVYNTDPVSYVEKIRNFGLSKVKTDWTLLLDPDEAITPELKKILFEFTNQSKYIAANISRKNIIFKKFIRHTNFWPDQQIRFFKTGSVKWLDVLHSYPIVDGLIYNFPFKDNVAIIHESYKSVSDFMNRQNRYSSNALKVSFVKPFNEFLVRYIFKLGILDGYHGLFLSYLLAMYQLSVWIKHEFKKNF